MRKKSSRQKATPEVSSGTRSSRPEQVTAPGISAEEQRRAQAAELFTEPKLDALLVTSLPNVRYLTGFTGSNGTVVLFRDGSATLVTDPRYTLQSQQQTNCRIRIAKGPITKTIAPVLEKARVRRIGFEGDHMPVARFEVLRKALPSRAEFISSTGAIEALRMVKDAAEIEQIRASVETNSDALEAALERFEPEMTESELAAEIDYQSRRLGADGPSFDTIVAAGERAALPHAHPGAARIRRGMVLIDMGAFRNGYASDMTRMVHVGRARPQYRRMYGAVLEAQLAAIAAVRPGITAGAVDRAARSVLKKHRLDKAFMHSTGHGLGLEIHEPPRLGRSEKNRLEAGMTITIEPGVYLEGWGGIRIEDTVLVTQKGCEVLTPTSKELRDI